MIRWAVFVALLLCSSPCDAASLLWGNDFDKALEEAKATGKPIFVDCVVKSCEWCRRMDQEVYGDPEFKKFLENYVRVRIDIEDGAAGSLLAAKHGVKTVPAVIVLDSQERLLNKMGGYWNAQAFILDMLMIQDLLQRERINHTDWKAIQLLAEEYLFRDMNAEAELRFKKILQAPLDSTAKESAHFSLALAQYYQEKTREALHTLNTYLETYAEGRSTEDVLLLLSQIYLETDAKDRAKEILVRFLEKFPRSQNAARVKEVLRKL
jgi:thioredoxin-related protein